MRLQSVQAKQSAVGRGFTVSLSPSYLRSSSHERHLLLQEPAIHSVMHLTRVLMRLTWQLCAHSDESRYAASQPLRKSVAVTLSTILSGIHLANASGH